MSHKLTRDEDKALWVEVRLRAAYDEGRGRTVHSLLAVRRKLEVAYERINPLVHDGPVTGVNFHPYGQRLSERAMALYVR